MTISVLNETLIFVVPHDKTDQTTVAVSALVWNGWEANYAIDGMINTHQGAGDSASIHQYHYMTITLPEVMVVRAVRLFSSAVSLFRKGKKIQISFEKLRRRNLRQPISDTLKSGLVKQSRQETLTISTPNVTCTELKQRRTAKFT